jgi:hypothetical protein
MIFKSADAIGLLKCKRKILRRQLVVRPTGSFEVLISAFVSGGLGKMVRRIHTECALYSLSTVLFRSPTLAFRVV